MPEQWQMCHHLSSTGNKDMSELIFTLPTHPNTSHSLPLWFAHVHLYLCEDFRGHDASRCPLPWPKVNSNLNCKTKSSTPKTSSDLLRERFSTLSWSSIYPVVCIYCAGTCVPLCMSSESRLSLSLLGCVYPDFVTGGEQHLFRGCCSSWMLFNWISSSRAKSCHLSLALLAITTGPYIK